MDAIDTFLDAVEARARELARMRRAGQRDTDAYCALWREAMADEVEIYESGYVARESLLSRVAAASGALVGGDA
jgi:hypothetical protein